MKRWSLMGLVLLLALLIGQTAWADLVFAKYFGSGKSRGMVLYFGAWVVLLVIPVLNRYLRVAAFYSLIFLLSRGFSRITDEQDPLRMVSSVESGLSLGLKIALPLLGLALIFKGAERGLRGLGFLSKKATEEEIAEALNASLKQGEDLEAFGERLAALGVKKSASQPWLEKYKARTAARAEIAESL